jgi:hypothetical protein
MAKLFRAEPEAFNVEVTIHMSGNDSYGALHIPNAYVKATFTGKDECATITGLVIAADNKKLGGGKESKTLVKGAIRALGSPAKSQGCCTWSIDVPINVIATPKAKLTHLTLSDYAVMATFEGTGDIKKFKTLTLWPERPVGQFAPDRPACCP